MFWIRAALERANKGCNKITETKTSVDAGQQKQRARAENNDVVKALGGLLEQAETPGKKPRSAGAFLSPCGSLRLNALFEQGCSRCACSWFC
jgi:hypothetical protein